MNRRVLQLSAALGMLFATPAAAFTMNYGDCADLGGGGTVTYEQVTETNAGASALYNAPGCIGNLIDFDPLGFEARDDADGNVDPVDVAGMLDFTVQASTNYILSSINLSEGGDEQVFGFGIAGSVTATMTIDLSIYVSDGGGGEIAVAYQDVQSVTYQLPGDNSSTLQLWMIEASYVLADILTDACFGLGQYSGGAIAAACGATSHRVGVEIDNLLEAFAEDGGLAFINKKETESLSVTTMTAGVPEPTTAALLGLGLIGLAAARRR